MISHEHKCIFIHIPKSAGTSIENVLGHFDNHTGRDGQDHRSIRMIEQPLITSDIFFSKGKIFDVLQRVKYQLRTMKNPRNKLTVTKEQYQQYFKFTFIRNPWARAFSWYKNVIRDDVHKKKYKIVCDISLKEFLQLYAGKDMLRPQVDWIKAFDGIIPLDFIGRFENLSEDFQEICRRMHIPQIKLPHKIKGSGTDYREYYDQDSINIITKIYKEEIELFDYSFER